MVAGIKNWNCAVKIVKSDGYHPVCHVNCCGIEWTVYVWSQFKIRYQASWACIFQEYDGWILVEN